MIILIAVYSGASVASKGPFQPAFPGKVNIWGYIYNEVSSYNVSYCVDLSFLEKATILEMEQTRHKNHSDWIGITENQNVNVK